MDRNQLTDLLEAVSNGALSAHEARARLEQLPFVEIDAATLDTHRELRVGVPEVVFGESKTAEEIADISAKLIDAVGKLFVTRIDADKATVVMKSVPGLRYAERARVLTTSPAVERNAADAPDVVVVSAGTSDAAVAGEALETLAFLGVSAGAVTDVGVAGIHRLLAKKDTIAGARIAIVVAGMEGALPSAVGGLVGMPIIAVPTSVGYGAAFDGIAALLGMMTSCAAGVTVVNIDNGFGAAVAAHLMLRATA